MGARIVHYLYMGHLNMSTFIIGISLSIGVSILLLREQLFLSDKQWLRRMIGHHSTALTSTTELLKTNNFKHNPKIYRLAKDTRLYTQLAKYYLCNPFYSIFKIYNQMNLLKGWTKNKTAADPAIP